MIDGTNKGIKCILSFKLDDGSNFELSYTSNLNNTNYVKKINFEEKISTSTDMPVGVNNGDVIDIEIISKNRALIPDNKSSIYYGHMNNKAIIEFNIIEQEETIYMGKLFVNSWKSSNNIENPNSVYIQAVNLMSIISKLNVPDININRSTYIKDYIIEVLNKLNSIMEEDKQVKINENDVRFDVFPVMQFCNIDTENIGNCFNGISQSTLTNIYISRDGYIKTDYNCDDIKEEAQYKLNVLTGAEYGTGMLVDYDGVKVKYSNGDIKDTEVIASIYNREVIKGENKISDISLGDAVFKVNRIECIPKDNSVFIEIKDANYNKNKMSIILDVENSTKADINVYGQRLDNTELVKELGGNNILEISNRIIPASYIDKYMDNTLKLMSIKNNCLNITGYITPKIKLGDIVYVDVEGGMNVSGYYKVIGLNWEFSTYSFCEMTLIKTFNNSYEVDSITEYLNTLFENRLYGIPQKSSDFISLSEEENNYVNEQLEEELTEFRKRLYGGV